MQFDQLKRRECAAATWPLAARAQSGERVPRVGVLMNLTADDAESRARNAAFQQGLGHLGWTDGRNVRMRPIGSRIHQARQLASSYLMPVQNMTTCTTPRPDSSFPFAQLGRSEGASKLGASRG